MIGMLYNQSCVICYFCKWIVKNIRDDAFAELLKLGVFSNAPQLFSAFFVRNRANSILNEKQNFLLFRIKQCIHTGKGFLKLYS